MQSTTKNLTPAGQSPVLALAHGSPLLDLTIPITFNEWFLRQHPKRHEMLRYDKWMLAEAAFHAGFESAQALANNRDDQRRGE